MKAWGVLILLSALPAADAFGAPSLAALRSFGFPETSAANPQAELIEGSDGRIYGTSGEGGSAGRGSVFKINKDGSEYSVLKSFGLAPTDGKWPTAALIEASDGALYGTSSEGGQFGYGTVFRLHKTGTNFVLLKSFAGADGAYPDGSLLEASDGFLYGTTSGGGGTNDFGVVFRLAKDGTGFELLHSFDGTNGANPEAGLIEASDEVLYGTTYSGGTTNVGCVFRVNKNGSGFAVVKSFISAFQTNGYGPLGGVVEGTNGLLYGTTSRGGTNFTGTIFSLSKDGSVFSTLRSLAGTNGRSPMAALIVATNGLLYGTAADGGASHCGIVFRLQHDGSGFIVLTNLVQSPTPAAALLQASDGHFYGTSQSGYGGIFRVASSGAFTLLKALDAAGGDGAFSYSSLTMASNGVFYGTTRAGGAEGAGTVFSIAATGQDYQSLWEFDWIDGGAPFAGLIEAADGDLYGTTDSGGASLAGTLFAIEKSGDNFRVLHNFSGGTNGGSPRAPVIQLPDGSLYGNTMLGGASNRGTIFRFDTNGGGHSVVKHFTGPDGSNPMQALTLGNGQQLFGDTYFANQGVASGILFRLNLSDSNYTTLKTFGAAPDAANPLSPLLEAADGMLYGTTYAGGATNNAGTVFRLNTNGTGFQILRSFTGLAGDGRHPAGTLVEGSDGAIYGVTERGGASDFGTLFKINKNGTGYAVLASFNGANGKYPRGGLRLGPGGALYGTTDRGGLMDFGTVFRYGPPLEGINDFTIAAGLLTVTCVGLPGTQYSVERTTALQESANWTLIGTTNAPPDGKFALTDTTPPPGTAFYRLRR